MGTGRTALAEVQLLSTAPGDAPTPSFPLPGAPCPSASCRLFL